MQYLHNISAKLLALQLHVNVYKYLKILGETECQIIKLMNTYGWMAINLSLQ